MQRLCEESFEKGTRNQYAVGWWNSNWNRWPHAGKKVVPRDQTSEKFKNLSNVYPNLADDNSVCDYVGSNGKQFAEEALLEWENICAVWSRNEDGSLPKCSNKATASVWRAAFVAAFCGRGRCRCIFFTNRWSILRLQAWTRVNWLRKSRKRWNILSGYNKFQYAWPNKFIYIWCNNTIYFSKNNFVSN